MESVGTASCPPGPGAADSGQFLEAAASGLGMSAYRTLIDPEKRFKTYSVEFALEFTPQFRRNASVGSLHQLWT